MDFRDWVVASLGLPGNIDSAIKMNLQLAAKTVKALNGATTRLDEETLTGAMIGALVSAHPMSAASYPADSETAIRWSSYTKHGGKIHSERNSGADFALVLAFPDGCLRLAIFKPKATGPRRLPRTRLSLGRSSRAPRSRMRQAG